MKSLIYRTADTVNSVYLRRKILFQFRDTTAPVIGGFLGYQFDIQETTLFGSIMMTGGCTFDDARGHVGDKILGKKILKKQS